MAFDVGSAAYQTPPVKSPIQAYAASGLGLTPMLQDIRDLHLTSNRKDDNGSLEEEKTPIATTTALLDTRPSGNEAVGTGSVSRDPFKTSWDQMDDARTELVSF